MELSVSLQCEIAMATLLAAAPFAVRVDRAATIEYSPEVMPAYNLARVDTGYADGNTDTRDSLAAVDRWMLFCYAAAIPAEGLLAAQASSEAVDGLLVWAHRQLQDETLGGLCTWVEVKGSKCNYDQRSGIDVIEVAVQLEVHYDIARNDPSVNANQEA